MRMTHDESWRFATSASAGTGDTSGFSVAVVCAGAPHGDAISETSARQRRLLMRGGLDGFACTNVDALGELSASGLGQRAAARRRVAEGCRAPSVTRGAAYGSLHVMGGTHGSALPMRRASESCL
jgi:hypothetical protein